MPPVWSFGWAIFVYIVTSVWVYIDASARGSSTAIFWSPFVIIFTPGFLYYLIIYRQEKSRVRERTMVERVIAVVALDAILSGIVVMSVAPSDPVSQTVYWIGSFLLILPVSYFTYRKLAT